MTSTTRAWFLLTTASALQLGPRDIRGELRAGSRFVPCHDFNPGWRETRESLFARGALVGVEFTVEEVLAGGATVPSVAEGDGAVSLVMRPSYRLARQYERADWPVTVPLAQSLGSAGSKSTSATPATGDMGATVPFPFSPLPSPKRALDSQSSLR